MWNSFTTIKLNKLRDYYINICEKAPKYLKIHEAIKGGLDIRQSLVNLYKPLKRNVNKQLTQCHTVMRMDVENNPNCRVGYRSGAIRLWHSLSMSNTITYLSQNEWTEYK